MNRNREWVDEFKLLVGCAVCEYRDHPAALDFDHLDPGSKKFGVARGLARSRAQIEAEIKKCRVLCANCHRIETWRKKHAEQHQLA